MFTIDTESGFRDAVMISAAYGLGENVVQGSVTPDEYLVFKPTLKTGHRPVLQKSIGSKEFKLIYDTGGGKMVKNVPVAPGDRAKLALTDDEVLQLARASSKIITPPNAASLRRWIWNGPRMASPANCSSCRRGRKRCNRAGISTCSKPMF